MIREYYTLSYRKIALILAVKTILLKLGKLVRN